MPDPTSPGNTHLHRFEIHKRFAHRLRRTRGVEQVSAEPSPMRPVRVRVTLDVPSFLDESYPAPTAELLVEWRPRPRRDVFKIQHFEPGSNWSCGWHQGDTHDELGPCHCQVDHRDWEAVHREPATFGDPNPMAVLETCIDELRDGFSTLPDEVAPER